MSWPGRPTAPYPEPPLPAPPARGRPGAAAAVAGAVVVVLLVTAVCVGVRAYHRQEDARKAAAALAAARHHQLVAARNQVLDAAHATYIELIDLRSALDGVPDPALQTPDEHRGEYAFWTQAREKSLQRLTGVPQVFGGDLEAPDPQWPALDHAGQGGLDAVTLTQSYLGALYGSPSPQLWQDKDAMRAAVQRQVRALVVAMVPVCAAAQPLDRVRETDCFDIEPDLPHGG